MLCKKDNLNLNTSQDYFTFNKFKGIQIKTVTFSVLRRQKLLSTLLELNYVEILQKYWARKQEDFYNSFRTVSKSVEYYWALKAPNFAKSSLKYDLINHIEHHSTSFAYFSFFFKQRVSSSSSFDAGKEINLNFHFFSA